MMTGNEYADLIAAYVDHTFGGRGVSVYREINVGTSIIGKNRRIDVFIHSEDDKKALAIECKYQDTQGTVDEKIPYALHDVEAMWMPACIAYAGTGYSQGVLHMLQGSEYAAFCFPDPVELGVSKNTQELDHIIASVFGWWDVLLDKKKPFSLEKWRGK